MIDSSDVCSRCGEPIWELTEYLTNGYDIICWECARDMGLLEVLRWYGIEIHTKFGG